MQRWILVSVCALASACSGSRGDSLDNTTLSAMTGDAAVDASEADGSTSSTADDDARVETTPDAGGDGTDEPGDASADDATQGPVLVLCGNGVIDPGEQCDNGSANSDSEAGACRLRCVTANCGDGILDVGEECDNGANNADHDPDACRTNCRAPRCGDGVRDNGEECDTGAALSDTEASACRQRCVLARCGDGVRDNDEGCDDANTVDTDACRNSCVSASCGDNVRTPDEECDDGNNVSGDGCQATCRNPRCGDGVKDEGEECDDSNTANNDGCRTDCKTGCVGPSECTDNVYCNGAESCVDGRCQGGSAPATDDGVACTRDACDEANNTVSHSPVDASCSLSPQTCTRGVVTTDSAQCIPNRGCANSPSMRACPDRASSCTEITGGYRLIAYTPACNGAGDDCGAPAVTGMRDCTAGGARCEGRVSIVSRPTCDAASETCGVVDSSRDDCARLDTGACSARNVSFTRTVGVCGGGACSSNTTKTDCTRAATCSGGQRTLYTPVCDPTNGCGTPTANTSACPVNPAVSCTNFGAGSVGSHYEPSCQDGATCSTDGTVVNETCMASHVCSTKGEPGINATSGGCNANTGRCTPATFTSCAATCGVRNTLCGGGCTDGPNGPACTACRVCANNTTCTTVGGVSACR